jgi:DNA-binding NtrC family response regulator
VPAVTVRPPIFAASAASRELLRQATRYADLAATVVITGETGVGKDALARFLHASGWRRSAPFVAVDCAAIPASLVEAELFGCERGAFTDATTARAGRLEQAAHGTIYFDNLASLSGQAQGALLRVLDDRRVTRLGGTTTIDVRARIIVSVPLPLGMLAADAIIRPDLYYRLNVLPIHIPPLRERRDEILPLARYFLKMLGRQYRISGRSLSESAREALFRYHWPGNVRELRHVIERVLLSAPGERIDAGDLPVAVLDHADCYVSSVDARRPTLAEVERRYITLTLHVARGNHTRAAAILGISRKGLWEKRKRFALG